MNKIYDCGNSIIVDNISFKKAKYRGCSVKKGVPYLGYTTLYIKIVSSESGERGSLMIEYDSEKECISDYEQLRKIMEKEKPPKNKSSSHKYPKHIQEIDKLLDKHCKDTLSD
ncbi:hypothetical protein ACFL0U_03335 [Pseudomonadota bacterium]